MRPTQLLRSGGSEGKPNIYIGNWGNMGSTPQKGIVYYGLAQNRLNPLSGAFNSAIFNTFRRTRNQILYWSVPLLIGYYTMEWATERNHFLNSKEGRKLYADSE